MQEQWIVGIIITTIALIRFIKDSRRHRYRWRHDVPDQLAVLVRQAHYNQPFETMWNIKVSDAMREALQAPLTPHQIRSMLEAVDDDIRKFVQCSVISYKVKTRGISGIVNVTIDIKSRSGLHDYHFSDIMLRISVDSLEDTVDPPMTLRSVEQL